jgi:hypothetical protein
MLGAILRRWAADANAAADAMERLARKPTLTIEVRTSGDRGAADAVRRRQRPEEMKAITEEVQRRLRGR